MMSIYKSFGFSNFPYHPITDYTWFVDPLSFTKSVLFCCFPLHAQMQIDLLFLFSCTNSTLFLVPSCTNVAQFVIPSPNTNAMWSGLFMYKCGLICRSSPITNAAQFIHP